MIDVSQWRASIGLWNYCQAASSRPARSNGHLSHSFEDSKSDSTTSGVKTIKLPAALSFIVSLLLSLLRYMKLNLFPPNGKITVMNCLQPLVLFIGSNCDLIYFLVLFLLLLLAGDVERNPGPMIDDQPSCLLFAKCLKPLVDWKPFALCLPGITQSDVNVIVKTKRNAHLKKMALHKKWLQANPQASWRDVITALKQCKENELVKNIEHQLKWSTGGTDTDDTTSTNPIGRNSNDNVEVITSTNPGHITGNPKDVLRIHSHLLTDGISSSLYRITSELLAKGLIQQQTFDDVLVMGVMTDYTKAMKLMSILQRQLESSLNPKQYLIDICHVLINQQQCTLTDIATSILHQFGQSIPDNVSSHTVLPSPVDNISNTRVTNIRGQSDVAKPIISIPDDVQGYADNMRQLYKNQPIVATDWPPRIGKDYFGRLALIEKQDSSMQTESAWHLLRGQVDKTVKLTENKEISIEDVLQPSYSSLSLRVVIDGPPGIGKTTLCRKILNMWSNRTLVHQQYDLVLYCPLRNNKIATAISLADLFEFKSHKVLKAVDWLSVSDGEGLLIIFDGWDELSEQLRQSSLAASIIRRKQLYQCSVIVTSRSYASSSLLEISNLSRHVQVIGFSEEEISIVIIQTLQKDAKLAQELIDKKREDDKNNEPFTTTQSSKDSQLAVKLINDLKVRDDAQSLCYIPLVCSMVILVYCKEGGHLPTTLTELYENFILQTIRRHIKKHDINPDTLSSLSSLPSQLADPYKKMCQLAYTNLVITRMTFSSHQLQSMSEVVMEDYLGLMTTFPEYDEEKYQFLHLSIQEFLAAWWITKHENTEEVFKDHFYNDHFRMCLRFVAGLTHLEHNSYQQYFNNQQFDLQCKKKQLSGFETCCLSYFYQNPEIDQYDHVSSDVLDNVPILLLQLLYESQNTTLCQVLAQSMNNHSLCLLEYIVSLSLFDWFCLSFCINNSNTTWNHLHLDLHDQSLSIFTAGLTNKSLRTNCKRLEVVLHKLTDELLLHKLLQPTLLHNIKECYCELSQFSQYFPCLLLLQFLNLPQLKVLHLKMTGPTIPTVDNTYYTDKCTELEKCIEMNSTLQELKIQYFKVTVITDIITSVIRGVSRNKTITSLSMHILLDVENDNTLPPHPLPDVVIEQLLEDNNTLQALSLGIPNELLPSSLNIVEVRTPLTALEIGEDLLSSELMTLLIPHIKRLHCLILHEPYPPHLLFDSHPSLQTLTLALDTAETVIELFTILQTNTTLKALSVEMKEVSWEWEEEEVEEEREEEVEEREEEEEEGEKEVEDGEEEVLEEGEEEDMKEWGKKNVEEGEDEEEEEPELEEEEVDEAYIRMGTSLQNMLTQNQTLKHLEINDNIPNSDIPSSFLSFLTTGLRHNNSLQQLSVPIPLNEEIRTFINIISQKNNLTELKVNIKVDQSYNNSGEEEEKYIIAAPALFYELLVPAVTKMLQSHTTIRLLRIESDYSNDESSQPNWIQLLQHLYETIFIHPSLEYIEFNPGDTTSLLADTLKDHKKILIDRHRKEQPHKPLPIVYIIYTD